MSRLRVRFFVTALVFLSYIAVAAPSYAAVDDPAGAPAGTDTPAGVPPGTERAPPAAHPDEHQPAPAAGTTPARPDPASTSADTSKSDTPAKSPDEFIPSESISEDFNVPFPVDI